jgi:inosine/xanthosine triphosphate pyrophosphatase family protein
MNFTDAEAPAATATPEGRRLRQLLNGCGWRLVTPADIGLSLQVEESGRTYEENACQKALLCAGQRPRRPGR